MTSDPLPTQSQFAQNVPIIPRLSLEAPFVTLRLKVPARSLPSFFSNFFHWSESPSWGMLGCPEDRCSRCLRMPRKRIGLRTNTMKIIFKLVLVAVPLMLIPASTRADDCYGDGGTSANCGYIKKWCNKLTTKI